MTTIFYLKLRLLIKIFDILKSNIILILLFTIPCTVLPQSVEYDVSQTDFYFTLSDEVKLECTKFIPLGEPPIAGWPAVVFCHGYGGHKGNEQSYAREQATIGYYTIVYSMRGQGKSEGKSNLISSLEMRDFMELVNFVKNEEYVNRNKIAAVGGSQGGTIPFMAACNGMDLTCIVSDVAAPDFATSWIENNSVKMTLLWSLSYDSTIVRYNDQLKRMRHWILNDLQPGYWDSIAFYMPLERDFMDRVHTNKSPIIISTVWQDKFFSTQGMIKAAYLLNVPYRMYFGTFDAHGADPYEKEMKYQEQFVSNWLEYWMRDNKTGIIDSVRFTYASSIFPQDFSIQPPMWNWVWNSSPVWPPEGTNSVKFYFNEDNELSTSYDQGTGYITLKNEINDSNLTLLEAINREFKGEVFESKFKKNEHIFDSQPLDQNVLMAGTPRVHLRYNSNAPISQYNFQIWEIHPDKTAKLVTRANYTDRKNNPNSEKYFDFYGISHSHMFMKGSKIRIIITNLDNTTDDRFLRSNPHVLPVIMKAKTKIYTEGKNATYIELPLINYK